APALRRRAGNRLLREGDRARRAPRRLRGAGPRGRGAGGRRDPGRRRARARRDAGGGRGLRDPGHAGGFPGRGPGPRMTADRVGGAALLVLALYVAWESRRLPLGTHHGPGPGYFPLLLASAPALTALVVMVRGREAPAWSALTWVEAPRGLAILGAAAFAALALERLGYRMTIAALLVLLVGVVERRRPWVAVVVAVVVAFGSFWVFNTLLRV